MECPDCSSHTFNGHPSLTNLNLFIYECGDCNFVWTNRSQKIVEGVETKLEELERRVKKLEYKVKWALTK